MAEKKSYELKLTAKIFLDSIFSIFQVNQCSVVPSKVLPKVVKIFSVRKFIKEKLEKLFTRKSTLKINHKN